MMMDIVCLVTSEHSMIVLNRKNPIIGLTDDVVVITISIAHNSYERKLKKLWSSIAFLNTIMLWR